MSTPKKALLAWDKVEVIHVGATVERTAKRAKAKPKITAQPEPLFQRSAMTLGEWVTYRNCSGTIRVETKAMSGSVGGPLCIAVIPNHGTAGAISVASERESNAKALAALPEALAALELVFLMTTQSSIKERVKKALTEVGYTFPQ